MNVQGISPFITAPVQAQSSNATNATSNPGSSSSSTGTSASSLQSTFLNLLVTELQNQDPTQPVDPTEMVSQMVSLNQLDQLISINQTLSSMSSPATSGTSAAASQNAAAAKTQSAQSQAQLAGGLMPFGSAAAQDAAKYLVSPVSSGLMNLYGSFAAPATSSLYSQTGVR